MHVRSARFIQLKDAPRAPFESSLRSNLYTRLYYILPWRALYEKIHFEKKRGVCKLVALNKKKKETFPIILYFFILAANYLQNST